MWLWRKPRRRVWLYAFAKGFMLVDDPRAEAVPVRWSQVIEVSEVWTDVYDPTAEEYQPRLTAYSLRCADGQAHKLSRYLQNVQDPYFPVGQFLKNFMPAAVGQTMPAFPTIDEIIAAYPGRQDPRA
jgi:hypothetical protein